jgi:hypothetical protein
VVCGIISYISHNCVITVWPANVAQCLQCLDAIVCYSFIPKGNFLAPTLKWKGKGFNDGDRHCACQ